MTLIERRVLTLEKALKPGSVEWLAEQLAELSNGELELTLDDLQREQPVHLTHEQWLAILDAEEAMT